MFVNLIICFRYQISYIQKEIFDFFSKNIYTKFDQKSDQLNHVDFQAMQIKLAKEKKT